MDTSSEIDEEQFQYRSRRFLRIFLTGLDQCGKTTLQNSLRLISREGPDTKYERVLEMVPRTRRTHNILRVKHSDASSSQEEASVPRRRRTGLSFLRLLGRNRSTNIDGQPSPQLPLFPAYPDVEVKKFPLSSGDTSRALATTLPDGVVLVVDAQQARIPFGPATTKLDEFLAMCRLFEICTRPKLIIVLSRVDMLDSIENEYRTIVAEIRVHLAKAGYDSDQIRGIPIIPTSVLRRLNIVHATEPWYSGVALAEAINQIPVWEDFDDYPLRMTIHDVYKIGGIGTVPVGEVLTGIIRPSTDVVFAPSGSTGSIVSMEMHHESIEQAYSGHLLGFHVRNVSVREIRRGSVAGSPDDEDPPQKVEFFRAKVLVVSPLPSNIRRGYSPVIEVHSARIACRFERLDAKIDRITGRVIADRPPGIKAGDCAIVTLKPVKPICLEEFAEFPKLGSFALRDLSTTVAVGIVTEVFPRVKRGRRVDQTAMLLERQSEQERIGYLLALLNEGGVFVGFQSVFLEGGGRFLFGLRILMFEI